MLKPILIAGLLMATAAVGLGAQAARAESGRASFYGHGKRTANGEHFNPNGMTAAHKHLPFGTRVRVTDQATGRSVVVRINDRGPFVHGRVIDLTTGAARVLGITGRGVADVRLAVLG